MRGRPLAFLATVTVGWSMGRIWMLLPAELTRPLTLIPDPALAETATIERPVDAVAPSVVVQPSPFRRAAITPPVSDRSEGWRGGSVAPVAVGGTADRTVATTVVARPVPTEPIVPGLPTVPVAGSASRWSGSVWVIARDGGGGALLSPLLGGSQAGVRIAYRLDGHGRLAAFARLAAPLRLGNAELAAGVQLRPAAAPITVFAEVRAIRGQASPAIGAFGGSAIALPARFRLEAYGQAGVIKRAGVSGFGDGQARLVRIIGPVEAGASVWGAAQRGASRLDVGPSVAVPIQATSLALRVSLDWRHRVAGNARPASGPVVSLGADF